MVQMSQKILENTQKYKFISYGDPAMAYTLVAKILCREIFVTGTDVPAFETSYTNLRTKYPSMHSDMIFKRIWDRYCSMSTPLLFEGDHFLPDA